MKKIDELMLKAYVKSITAKENIKEYMNSEKGISDLVITILVLAIAVILIGVFWDKLSEWLNGIMDGIFGFKPSGDKLID